MHSVRCYCLSKVASPSLLHKVSDKAHTETLCQGGRMRKRDTVNPAYQVNSVLLSRTQTVQYLDALFEGT